MREGQPPFRADQVGSLVRPARLIAARQKHDRNEMPDDELARIEDEEIRRAVALQEDIGFQVVTDGEFRRESWNRDFLLKFDERRAGAEPDRARLRPTGGKAERAPTALAVTGKISRPQADLRGAFQIPEVHRARDAEAHHPLADHPAFPRRPRVDRHESLSRHGSVLCRRGAGLQRGDQRPRRMRAAAICRSTT